MSSDLLKWGAITVSGAIISAIVVYQLKKRTKGVVDDE